MGLCAAYGDYGGYGGYGDYQAIHLPIQSHDAGVKVIPSPSYVNKHKTEVKIPAGEMPVYVTFLSKTSPVHVDQKHKSTKGSYKKSKSVDEPHKLVHEVVKPVYQTIKEIIKPYRKVVQVVEPVKVERLTKVHKAEEKDDQENEYEKGYGQKKIMGGVLKNLDVDQEYLQR